MTSFMIRDILNLTSSDSEQSDLSTHQPERKHRNSPDRKRKHSVSTMCAREVTHLSRDVTHLSRDVTHLSRDVTRSPEEVCAVIDKRNSSESGSPGMIQTSWSRNKMKVRTVFTDIQRQVLLILIHH